MALPRWFRRRRADDDDLQEEIRSHLAIAADERMAEGADRTAARLSSLKDFGNVTHTTEAVREVWTPGWLEALNDIGRDAGLAARRLLKNPGFSLTVVAVLTVGIGLNAMVFTLLKSLALSPISGVTRSMNLTVVLNEATGGRRSGLSYVDYQYLRDHDQAFAGLLGSSLANASLGTGNRAERIMSEFVTGNYFELLGVRAQLGRTLTPQDEIASGQHPVAVISDELWRRRFGSDPAIVGQTIKLNTYPLTIVGVTEPSFHGTIVSFDIEVFVPIMMAPQVGLRAAGDSPHLLTNAQAEFLMVLGRLRPGVTRSDASAQMALLTTQLKDDDSVNAVEQQLKVLPIWQSPYGAQTYLLPAVTVLLGMGALLLMLACANVAGLVLARAVSRRGEIALRLALGASRRRIVRLLLVENAVLALPAALICVVILPRLVPLVLQGMAAAAPVRIFLDLSVDRLVIGFSIVAAFASALAFGLFPAIQSSKVALQAAINEDLSPRGAVRGRFRAGLVIAQVAVSLLLLVGAGLVTKSLDAARNADPGFDWTNVVSARVDLQPNGYDKTRGIAFFEQLLDRVRADAGTEAATLASTALLTLVDDGERNTTVEGYTSGRDEDLTFLSNVVAPDYFRTLKIDLLAGREFARADQDDAPLVVIVNETMARRFWSTPAEALGKRMRVSTDDWRTIVGVVGDVKYSRINEGARPYVYLPFFQNYAPMMLVYARSPVGPAASMERLRTHVTEIDPELPLMGVTTLREQSQASLTFLELAAAMLFVFGVAGMVLAAMGIYGLVAYTVRQSTHEIGIRMALGAHGAGVVWTFLKRGLRLGAIGALAGTVVALATTQLLASVLYGVSPTDIGSFAGAFALVVAIVCLATLLPSWRAARTNLLSALRHQ